MDALVIQRLVYLVLCPGVILAATAPALTYSTYLGNLFGFGPNAIATDSSGNVYLAGSGAASPTPPFATAGLVIKINPQSGQILYQTSPSRPAGQLYQVVNAIAVDASGNAYVAGTYGSPEFSSTQQQAFVAKLDPSGNDVFSVLLGRSAASQSLAIALTSTGNILVTGMSLSSTFPSTPGAAYSVSDTTNRPYLLELDPTGAKTIFSATGIGGDAIALDPGGNIYVAGTTTLLDYPTTPGVYEPVFPVNLGCTSPLCQIEGQASTQYLTKIDPTGSTLIYSTALPGWTNMGLAVDASGNAYVTGVSFEFPYSVPAPSIPNLQMPFSWEGLPFLAKVDPAGQNLLFAVPVGGGGVQVDSSGAVYIAGGIGQAYGEFSVDADLPALDAVTTCRPNQLTILRSAYVSQVDGASGHVLGTQFIGGSDLSISASALSGSTLWVTGSTGPAVPFTPNAIAVANPSPYSGGPYMGAVDFSQPAPPGSPQIFCLVNADGTEVGPAALNQVVSIFGTGLGPSVGVSAPDFKTTTLAGVEVTFGGTPAPLLYVSSTQINLAIPILPASSTFPSMRVSVGEAKSPPSTRLAKAPRHPSLESPARAIPITSADPTLFISMPQSYLQTFVAMALNADGSVNSLANPATPGSIISVFVDGLGPDPNLASAPGQFAAQGGFTVVSAAQYDPFVSQLNLQTPSTIPPPNAVGFDCPPNGGTCSVSFTLSYGASPVGTGMAGSATVFVTK